METLPTEKRRWHDLSQDEKAEVLEHFGAWDGSVRHHPMVPNGEVWFVSLPDDPRVKIKGLRTVLIAGDIWDELR